MENKKLFEENILEATKDHEIETVIAALMSMYTRGREYKDWRGRFFGVIERRFTAQELYDALVVVFKNRAQTLTHPNKQ